MAQFEAKKGSSVPMQFNVNPDNEDFRPLTEAVSVRIYILDPDSVVTYLTATIVNGWELKAKLLGSAHTKLGSWAAEARADYGNGDVQIGDTVTWTTIDAFK